MKRPEFRESNAISDQLRRIGRPEHRRRLLHVFRTLIDHHAQRGQRSRIVPTGDAVVCQLQHRARRNVSQVEVVFLDVGGPALVRREHVIGRLRMRLLLLAFVSSQWTRPLRLIDGEANCLSAIHKLDFRKGQGRSGILLLGGVGQRRCQPFVIESWTARILFRIDQDKVRPLQTGSAVPEAVRLLNPMWIYVRDGNQMPHIPRKETFGPLVVLQGALCKCSGRSQRQQ